MKRKILFLMGIGLVVACTACGNTKTAKQEPHNGPSSVSEALSLGGDEKEVQDASESFDDEINSVSGGEDVIVSSVSENMENMENTENTEDAGILNDNDDSGDLIASEDVDDSELPYTKENYIKVDTGYIFENASQSKEFWTYISDNIEHVLNTEKREFDYPYFKRDVVSPFITYCSNEDFTYAAETIEFSATVDLEKLGVSEGDYFEVKNSKDWSEGVDYSGNPSAYSFIVLKNAVDSSDTRRFIAQNHSDIFLENIEPGWHLTENNFGSLEDSDGQAGLLYSDDDKAVGFHVDEWKGNMDQGPVWIHFYVTDSDLSLTETEYSERRHGYKFLGVECTVIFSKDKYEEIGGIEGLKTIAAEAFTFERGPEWGAYSEE